LALAPDVSSGFYHRSSEIKQLQKWIINEECRVVALLGIPGIGKTALAAKVVQEIKGQFDRVIWRSLNQNTPLDSLLGTLGVKSIRELVQSLQPQPSLIIFDG